jgi:maltose alpha-D-glucosyltransferase/alpha-amylase
MIRLTGKDDTRFLVRGKIDWNELELNLQNPKSFSSHIYQKLKQMLHVRNQYTIFGRGEIEFITLPGSENGDLLSFIRSSGTKRWLIIHNMTDQPSVVNLPAFAEKSVNVFDDTRPVILEPYGFCWLKIN